MTFVTTQPNEQARWRSLLQKFNPLRPPVTGRRSKQVEESIKSVERQPLSCRYRQKYIPLHQKKEEKFADNVKKMEYISVSQFAEKYGISEHTAVC